jgi:hypothetical protein
MIGSRKSKCSFGAPFTRWRRVFEGRHQHGFPDRLPTPPTEWAVPYRKLVREVPLDPELRTADPQVAALLDPILAGRTAGRWDPRRQLRGRHSFLEIRASLVYSRPQQPARSSQRSSICCVSTDSRNGRRRFGATALILSVRASLRPQSGRGLTRL